MKTQNMIMNRTVILMCFVFLLCACGSDDKAMRRDRNIDSSAAWDEPAKTVYTPPWPEDVKINHEGTAVVHLTINTDGFIDLARLEQSSEHAYLDSVVLEIFQRTVWTPARKDGRPVKMHVSIPYLIRMNPDQVDNE